MPWVVAIAAVASAAIGAYSAVSQGQAAEEAGKRTADAENANAKAAMDAAALEAGQVRRKNLLRLGAQRAAAAKSGVLIDDSAADVIYDTAIQGELEAQSVLYSGASAAAYNRSRASIARLEGKNARKAGNIGATATLIGGASNVASSWPSGSSQNQPSFSSGGGSTYGSRYKSRTGDY